MNQYGDVSTLQVTSIPQLLRGDVMVNEIVLLPFVDLMRVAPKYDFSVFIPIWGVKGVGKTTLMMWYLHTYYGDWNKAIYNYVQTLPELIQKTEGHGHIDVIGWDDMVIHFGKWTKSWNKIYRSFFEYFQGIRTKTNFFMATMVLPKDLPLAMRESFNGEVFMPRRGIGIYQSYSWKMDSYRPGEAWFRKFYVEALYINAPLPSWVSAMLEKRRGVLLNTKREEIKQAILDAAAPAIKKEQDWQTVQEVLVRGSMKGGIEIDGLPEQKREIAYRLVYLGLIVESDVDAETRRIKFRTTKEGEEILEGVERRAAAVTLGPDVLGNE